eukprot:scaffold67260_cov53-Attheya_sp.AAC.2
MGSIAESWQSSATEDDESFQDALTSASRVSSYASLSSILKSSTNPIVESFDIEVPETKMPETHIAQNGKAPQRRPSTNPFDSYYDDSVPDTKTSLEKVPTPKTKNAAKPASKRSANLDFNFNSSEAKPALQFNPHVEATDDTLISPLEFAFLNVQSGDLLSPSNARNDSDGDVENDDSEAESEDEDVGENVPLVEQSYDSEWGLSNIMQMALRFGRTGETPRTTTHHDLESQSSEPDAKTFFSFRSAKSSDNDDIFVDAMEGDPDADSDSFLCTSHASAVQRDQGVRRTSLSDKSFSRPKTLKKRSSVSTKHGSRLLKELDSEPKDCEFTMDQRSMGTPWTKLIILEELGTASSWLILLLPYVALIASIILDSNSKLSRESVGPLAGNSLCVSHSRGGSTSSKGSFYQEVSDILTTGGGFSVPLKNAPSTPCSYPYAIHDGEGLLSYGKNEYDIINQEYQTLMSYGVAVTSGPLEGIPATSTFLFGDATFTNLSSSAVALVARGQVLVSTVLFQRKMSPPVAMSYRNIEKAGNQSEETAVQQPDDWVPVKISVSQYLPLACELNNLDDSRQLSHSKTDLSWTCTSPRLVDVLFSMPGTAVLMGTDMRLEVLFAYTKSTKETSDLLAFHRSTNGTSALSKTSKSLLNTTGSYTVPDAKSILADADISHPILILSELAASSSFSIEQERPEYAFIFIVVRLSCLAVSVLFLIYWTWSMGVKGLFFSPSCCCCWGSPCCTKELDEETLPIVKKPRTNTAWWESPWILLPERRYLSVLLGLRYHTAKLARKRADQQRQMLQLRRAAKYLSSVDHPDYGAGESMATYSSSYYEQYGDIDGSGSVVALHLRLKHDPCGDNWADFLLPKLFLFLLGCASVIIAAIYRFPPSMTESESKQDSHIKFDPDVLRHNNKIYVASSFTQLFILLLWVFLIILNAFITGARLKNQPFLSTRPAQLAFRILSGIMFLGMASILVPILADCSSNIGKWTLRSPDNGESTLQGQSVFYDTSASDYAVSNASLDVLLRVLTRASRRFPYSGTASSIGPGKLLFVTVCSLLAAFIFLPSSSFYQNDDETGKLNQRKKLMGKTDLFRANALGEIARQRRDKRLVVTLARYAHTWRVFPLPMKRPRILLPSNLPSVRWFQIDYNSFRANRENFGRGTIFMGRYIPVFCVEIACWLLEASWQAYYTTEFSSNDWAPGRINLESIGLQLEGAIYDENTHTQAFIASNVSQQVDGETDSVIVVSFRGTATTTNMRTDLRFRQVPLPEKLSGNNNRPSFRMRRKGIDPCPPGAWDLKERSAESDQFVHSFSPTKPHSRVNFETTATKGSRSKQAQQQPQSAFSVVSAGTKSLIRATPMARQALPCVHEGFLEVYSHVRKQILQCVLAVLQRQFDKAIKRAKSRSRQKQRSQQGDHQRSHDITGHSLGGAMAQLLALDLASNCELIIEPSKSSSPQSKNGDSTHHAKYQTPSRSNTSKSYQSSTATSDDIQRNNDSPVAHDEALEQTPDSFHSDDEDEGDNFRQGENRFSLQPAIAVYTYGQPRVGNHAFARLYKQRVPHTFRVVHECDAITSMPSLTFCGGLYKHAGLEVMLDEGCTGNTLIGPTVVETLFRFTKVRASLAAHQLDYYRDALESALTPDELHEYYRGHGGGDRSSFSVGTGNSSIPDWVTQIKRASGD